MKKEFEETVDKFFNDVAPVIVLPSCCLAAWLYPDVIAKVALMAIGIVYVLTARDIKRYIRTVEAAKKQKPRAQAIRSNHGNFITEFMEQIRGEEYEYLAFFDLKGQKLAEGTLLSPYTCNITVEDWYRICYRSEGVIMVHNHPSSNRSFSVNDFSVFFWKDFIKMSIVVTKDYNFILEKDWVGYETFHDVAKSYAEKMLHRYKRLNIISDHFRSVVVSYMVARRYDLQFGVENIHRTSKSASRTILARAAQHY